MLKLLKKEGDDVLKIHRAVAHEKKVNNVADKVKEIKCNPLYNNDLEWSGQIGQRNTDTPFMDSHCPKNFCFQPS